MEVLFQILNILVIPFWILMIFLPRWRWTTRVIASPWIAAPVSLIYVAVVLPRMPLLLLEISNPELENIAQLLGTPEGATVAWAHFVAFDLLVGRWSYMDSQSRGISGWLMAPVLALIFLFGPLGLTFYLLVQRFFAKIPQGGAAPQGT